MPLPKWCPAYRIVNRYPPFRVWLYRSKILHADGTNSLDTRFNTPLLSRLVESVLNGRESLVESGIDGKESPRLQIKRANRERIGHLYLGLPTRTFCKG